MIRVKNNDIRYLAFASSILNQLRVIAMFLFLFISMFSSSLLAQSNKDCRLKSEELKPIIKAFNPYFANHKWLPATQLELARLGNDRLVLISQGGCKRHHTSFSLSIDPDAVEQNQAFWLKELRNLLDKIYHGQEEQYLEFRDAFLETFEEKFKESGIGRPFNFPIGTRNFICELMYSRVKGGKITVEMIAYIFEEKMQQGGKKKAVFDENDDGWKAVRKP